ncbi:hypothetical protein N4T20_14450 [Flavobacterium sp. TR2]|uniref:hypothetical protein n=1 Tax=Flavobacterium sp. TR2 TaxID=2977321 RepID=UPI0021B12443|nr:hypothetical protein [Flavobacterium sp. TR2]UWY26921.1 hypothetical protein N4T20_14450 [Flavobacterium sp. TR2]
MFKLRLYKFLSIFIPYFKKKMNQVILNHIENHIQNQINDYKNKRLFKFHEFNKEYNKDENSYIVTINIEYQDILFYVGLKYQSNEIEFLSDVSMTHKNFDDLNKISKFMKHISKIDKNYLKRKFEYRNKF